MGRIEETVKLTLNMAQKAHVYKYPDSEPLVMWEFPGVLPKEGNVDGQYFPGRNAILLNVMPPSYVRRELKNICIYYNTLLLHELSHWAGAHHNNDDPDTSQFYWDFYLNGADPAVMEKVERARASHKKKPQASE